MQNLSRETVMENQVMVIKKLKVQNCNVFGNSDKSDCTLTEMSIQILSELYWVIDLYVFPAWYSHKS